MELQDNLPFLTESAQSDIIKTSKRKNFITSKLVAALDRCQLSTRNSVFIIEATIEALGHNTDGFPISKSSVQRIRTKMWKERAIAIKVDFQNEVLDTVHYDGKLLPALDARKSKEERLPIVISYDNKKQLITLPKLDNSSGSEQSQAVWNAIIDWNLEDKGLFVVTQLLQIQGVLMVRVCFSNRNWIEKCLFLLAAITLMKLVLKDVLEAKISQTTASPDIPLFKNCIIIINKSVVKYIEETIRLDLVTQRSLGIQP